MPQEPQSKLDKAAAEYAKTHPPEKNPDIEDRREEYNQVKLGTFPAASRFSPPGKRGPVVEGTFPSSKVVIHP